MAKADYSQQIVDALIEFGWTRCRGLRIEGSSRHGDIWVNDEFPDLHIWRDVIWRAKYYRTEGNITYANFSSSSDGRTAVIDCLKWYKNFFCGESFEPDDKANDNDRQHGGSSVNEFNQSGSKYLREMRCLVDGYADVYAVLEAFAVTCPARQHAIKKLLCSGIRGKGDLIQDLKEARDAIDRAIQMQNLRQEHESKQPA
jgi:hypothetical protein